jgi:hypothetical protein
LATTAALPPRVHEEVNHVRTPCRRKRKKSSMQKHTTCSEGHVVLGWISISLCGLKKCLKIVSSAVVLHK